MVQEATQNCYIMFRKYKWSMKTVTHTLALQTATELACHAAEILRLLKTACYARHAFKTEEQRNHLHLVVPV